MNLFILVFVFMPIGFKSLDLVAFDAVFLNVSVSLASFITEMPNSLILRDRIRLALHRIAMAQIHAVSSCSSTNLFSGLKRGGV